MEQSTPFPEPKPAEFLEQERPNIRSSRAKFLRGAAWTSFVAFILLYSVRNIHNGSEEFPDHPARPHNPAHHPHHGGEGHPKPHGCHGSRMSVEDIEALMLSSPDTEKLSEWSKYYTAGAHIAGKNQSQAEWTRDKWEEFGVPSTVEPYNVYINYPLGHRLALLEQSDKEKRGGDDNEAWNVKFEASLTEDILKDDPTTNATDSVPTFHGYSASGNVTAQYVYVNYGAYQDFEDLLAANVSLKGNIAIARYGGIFRGLKVKRAQELGMIGTVLYTDPGDDHGAPGREDSSVQRGSTSFLSLAPGDPTTIGRPSKPGVDRDDPTDYYPRIPSLPISYRDALPILKALNGHGPAASDLNKWWNKDLGLKDNGVKYNIGPSPTNLKLNLVNEQEYVYQDIWNVIGVINGTLPTEEVIVVGNHRDAWIVGGAGDPNSGSAAMMEVVRAFGQAVKRGWRPLRTIVFASWDGEEYGLLGSTEWVEDHIPWLTEKAVSYVNIDVGCSGPRFQASASPLLNGLIYNVTGMVPSPNQTIRGQTVRDVWTALDDANISTMGSGSDFTAFQDFIGVASLDFGFKADADSPVYHYHSNYDSYHWMSTAADPDWKIHQAASRILGLLVSKLAGHYSDNLMIPFGTSDYGDALKTYIGKIEDKLNAKEPEASFRTREVVPLSASTRDTLKPIIAQLQIAADGFRGEASRFDWLVENLKQKVRNKDIPWWKFWEKLKLAKTVFRINQAMILLERRFIYGKGLDGREYFKHVIFAPGLWTGYSGAVFPGLAEAIDRDDVEGALKWAQIIKERIENAAQGLHITKCDM